jgi:hypothetical protein
MEPTTIPEPAGFSDLSKAEQIRYLQALWDRIAERPGEIPFPSRTSRSRRSGLPSTAEIQAARNRSAKCWIGLRRRSGDRVSAGC